VLGFQAYAPMRWSFHVASGICSVPLQGIICLFPNETCDRRGLYHTDAHPPTLFGIGVAPGQDAQHHTLEISCSTVQGDEKANDWHLKQQQQAEYSGSL